MKNQALFSSKDKSKKLKCRLLQFLFGVLRVHTYFSGELPLDLGVSKTLSDLLSKAARGCKYRIMFSVILLCVYF